MHHGPIAAMRIELPVMPEGNFGADCNANMEVHGKTEAEQNAQQSVNNIEDNDWRMMLVRMLHAEQC